MKENLAMPGLDEMERYLIEQLEEIARRHREAAAPIVKQLERVRALRPQPPVYLVRAEPLPGCDCPVCGRGNLIRQIPGTAWRKCDHCGVTVIHN